jgi:short-subunit dehydrogenase
LKIVFKPLLCSQSDFLWETTGMRVMVVCPAYTASEIIPDGQESYTVTYEDEWMDAFYTELENHKPPQE